MARLGAEQVGTPGTASRSCCTSSRSPRPAGRSAATTSRDHILAQLGRWAAGQPWGACS